MIEGHKTHLVDGARLVRDVVLVHVAVGQVGVAAVATVARGHSARDDDLRIRVGNLVEFWPFG